MPGALEGIRVLDLTSVLLGPCATQNLGDMGADVIKIESPEGDITRQLGPGKSPGVTTVFLGANRNKRGLVLDLKQDSAKAALRRLVATADVFVHSMRPQAAAKLGLTWEALSAIKPDLVYAAAYGYGAKGPYGHRPAYDDLIQGASSMAWLQQKLVGKPSYVPTTIADKVVSLVLTYAITTALFHRERTGEGQQVEVPMFESMVAWLMVEHLYGESYVPAIAQTGYPRVLSPDRRPYKTKDGHIGVLPYHDGHWRRFFELVGKPELMDDPRYRSASARLDNIDTLYATLEGFLGEKTTAEWQEIFDAASIPATPINTTDDLLEDPHLKAVGFWQEMDHPSEGRVRHYGFGPNFEATPASIRRQAPRHGEHSCEVLAEAGLDEAEIDELITSGAAVQAAPLSTT